jgi:hypothetical protein
MHHYTWVEMADFSGGMWTSQDWQVPQNGAALLEDCYPLPQGGLRAFGRFSTLTNTGISVDEEPIAIWVEDHVGGSDYFLITNTGTAQKLYRMNESAGATSWSALKTFTLTGEYSAQAYFASYQLAAETEPHIYLTIGATGSDKGLWRVHYSTGVVSRPTITTTATTTATLTGPICVHQDRLVIAEEFSQIWFTNPGVETIGDTNFIEVASSYRLSTITFMHPFRPNDLLVATRGAPWFLVQDDLTDPIIRSMGNVRHAASRQIPCETDAGIVFQAILDGVYATPDGAQFTKLSEPISVEDLWGDVGDELVSQPGSLAYLDNWLFTPSGHIFDTRTQAWFRITDWTTAQSAFALVANKHRSSHLLIAAIEPSSGAAATLRTLRPLESGMDRKRSYRYQSPPFHDDSGRQIEIGEVHVVCKTYNTASSCEVTVNGVTRTTNNLTQGRIVVPSMFRERDGQLDITIEMDSGSNTVEAPSIESIRVGVLKGHLLRTG